MIQAIRSMRRAAVATTAALAALLSSGCATTGPSYQDDIEAQRAMQPPGVAVGEVQALLAAGRSQSDIIAEVQARGVQSPPTSVEIEALRQAGASPELIDALLTAQVAPQVVAVVPARPWYWAWPWAPAYGGSIWYRSGPVYRGPIYRGPVYGGPGYRGPGYGSPGYGSPGAGGSYGGSPVRPPLGSPPGNAFGGGGSMPLPAPVKPPSMSPSPGAGSGAFGGHRGGPPAPSRPFKPSPGNFGRFR